ncbi:MAG: PAS domain-containing protein [Gemmatimonadetes bacterium]|nr:PAS domain-containing protein [Gemmatimonadota bacterium]
MTPLSPTTPASDGRAARALATLAGLSAELSSARSLETSIERILETLRTTLESQECALWMHTPQGLRRAWGSGLGHFTEAQVRAALTSADDAGAPAELRVVPIVLGPRRLGALALRLERVPEPEEELLLQALANVLAPELAHAERSRQLEVEVASRTMEIERGRRFTEKIIDSLPLGLYVIDREFRIQSWNRKRETGMQGVQREEAIGRTIFEILHRQPSEMLRREFEDVFSTGRMQEYQMESISSGEARTYRITKIPMRLGDGPVTHVITIGEDVTDWREAQERFSQAEKLAAIGQLAAGVMHEINNPLATIAACAESLGYRIEDLERSGVTLAPETHDFLGIIDNEVVRCKQIVDGLLEFSRPKQPRKERVNVNEVVERTLFLLKHHVRFKKLTVETSLDPLMGRVPHANAEQLVQVFMALLLNAMDAMGDRGLVRIVSRVGATPAEGAVVEVIDMGHGIARSEIGKIFEPFYTTKGPGKGTGLGLSICYGIVQEHGGRVEVESVLGQGSTFRVILPVVES